MRQSHEMLFASASGLKSARNLDIPTANFKITSTQVTNVNSTNTLPSSKPTRVIDLMAPLNISTS